MDLGVSSTGLSSKTHSPASQISSTRTQTSLSKPLFVFKRNPLTVTSFLIQECSFKNLTSSLQLSLILSSWGVHPSYIQNQSSQNQSPPLPPHPNLLFPLIYAGYPHSSYI
ncbi:hypothetical protein OCU04_010757 [Sclerotinia nivalis]|uniref:Uncharacterized protein n=1 Tax=Sclerotinia nivalis TaxID=352851 RepID=A0A9X0ACW1_9HELO|nr:hypothetical protein OCU04_010757 [Sclerotinia nivalis]